MSSPITSLPLPPTPSLSDLFASSRKRTRVVFAHTAPPPPNDMLDEPVSQRVNLLSKYHSEYAVVQTLPAIISQTNKQRIPSSSSHHPTNTTTTGPVPSSTSTTTDPLLLTSSSTTTTTTPTTTIPSLPTPNSTHVPSNSSLSVIPVLTSAASSSSSSALLRLGETRNSITPTWHAPWSLMRVISGHTGWVRAIAVDISNEWFVTGGGDRLIKIWDLASGQLKLTLTGHVSSVRGLAISERSPYLFSVGEDRMVKCWDLETNKVIRHYHGHLSGIYSLALHPTLDILATGGRDSTIRLWDMRTKHQIHVLTGHSSTIGSLIMQGSEYQLISSSHDSLIKLWDIRAGKCKGTLTHHKKSVRALTIHPTESTFVSGSADNVKQWVMTKEDPKSEYPTVRFIQNMPGHQGIINCLTTNGDGTLFGGCDNGSMHFWDWRSGYQYQSLVSQVQPGSLDSEAGIFAATFDRSGSRLITCEADKSIKVWKQDPNATPDSHPINYKPELKRTRY